MSLIGPEAFTALSAEAYRRAALLPTPGGQLVAEAVRYGLLLSYGQDFPDFFRRAVAYTDKILKGAKPADLPVEQPTKFKLVLNLRTAKALGFHVADDASRRR